MHGIKILNQNTCKSHKFTSQIIHKAGLKEFNISVDVCTIVMRSWYCLTGFFFKVIF